MSSMYGTIVLSSLLFIFAFCTIACLPDNYNFTSPTEDKDLDLDATMFSPFNNISRLQ
jgi:hypothetical protein